MHTSGRPSSTLRATIAFMVMGPNLKKFLIPAGIVLSLSLSTLSLVWAQGGKGQKSSEAPKVAVTTSPGSSAVETPKTKTAVAQDGQQISVTVPMTAPITFKEGAVKIEPPKPDPDWLKLAPIFSGLLGALIAGGVSLFVAKVAFGNALKLAQKQAADKQTTDFHTSRIEALSRLIGQVYVCQGVALQCDYTAKQLITLRSANQPITDGQGKLIGSTIDSKVILDAERERDKWRAEFYVVAARAIESAEEYGRVPTQVSDSRPHWGDWVLKARQDLLAAIGEDMTRIADICNQLAAKTRDLREYEEHLLASVLRGTQPEAFERDEGHALGIRSLKDRRITAAELERRVAGPSPEIPKEETGS